MAQPPPFDMSALIGVTPEQLALIAQAFQNGSLPLPPPQPKATAFPPTADHAPSPSAIKSAAAQKQSLHRGADGDIGTSMDMSKEEGEVEDGEPAQTSAGDKHLPAAQSVGALNHSSMTTSKARNIHQEPGQRISRESSHISPVKTSKRSQFGNGSRASPTQMQGSSRELQQRVTDPHVRNSQNASMKIFLDALLTQGYTHDQLAKQFSKPTAFRHFAEELRISSAPQMFLEEQIASSKRPNTLEQTETHAQQTPAPKIVKKSGPPQDRNAYLAKLQAAKNKKSESAAAPASSSIAKQIGRRTQTVVSPLTEASKTQLPEAAPVPTPIIKSSPRAKAAKDELLRQRLDALRAAKATKPSASESSSSANSPMIALQAVPSSAAPLSNGLGAGIAGLVASSAGQTRPKQDAREQQILPLAPSPAQNTSQTSVVLSPSSATPSRSFSGLPGLFMVNSAQAAPPVWPKSHMTSASVAETPTASSSNHPGRTVSTAANHGEVSVSSDSFQKRASIEGTLTAKGMAVEARPFGQSRATDEPFIIEHSDDDDDDEMDIGDSDNDEVKSSRIIAQSSKFVAAINKTDQAQPGTPKPNTSTSITRSLSGLSGQDAYNLKMKEIEMARRKLAEAEQRVRVKSSNVSASMPSSGPGTPLAQHATLPASVEATIVSAGTTADGTASPSGYRVTAKQDKEYWQRRHDELMQELGKKVVPSAKVTAATTVIASPLNPVDSQSLVKNSANAVAHQNLGTVSSVAATEPSTAMTNFDAARFVPDVDGTKNLDDMAANKPGNETLSTDTTGLMLAGAQVVPQTSDTSDYEDSDSIMDGVYDAGNANSPKGLSSSETLVRNRSVHDEDSTEDRDDEYSEANDGDDDDASMDTSSDDTSNVDHITGDDAGLKPGESLDKSDGVHRETEEHRRSLSSHKPDANSDEDLLAEADGLAQELQPTVEEQMIIAQEPTRSTHFTPYESLLAQFKDYRYHNDFLDSVPGGYKSLTYNHQIDPMTELCPYESSGGMCNDAHCRYQHFRSMTLSDNVLLRSLTTTRPPTRTPEDEKRWKAGLGELIKELKTTSLGRQDVTVIAQRIVQFRRDFINDPTRTLQLE